VGQWLLSTTGDLLTSTVEAEVLPSKEVRQRSTMKAKAVAQKQLLGNECDAAPMPQPVRQAGAGEVAQFFFDPFWRRGAAGFF
jgi:hypothetical protein